MRLAILGGSELERPSHKEFGRKIIKEIPDMNLPPQVHTHLDPRTGKNIIRAYIYMTHMYNACEEVRV